MQKLHYPTDGHPGKTAFGMTLQITSATSTRCALVVEDNPVFQDVLESAVSSLGSDWTVVICSNGADALEFLATGNACLDLALVDIGLPDISGVKIIEAIHGQMPEVAIMVVSVITSEEMVLGSIRAGARGYITKSQSDFSVAESIKEVLSGNYPISPSLARSLFCLAGAPTLATPNPFRLTAREIETLQFLSKGLTYGQVAEAMGITLSTVQSNIRNLYRKLEVHSQAQAICKAHQMGMIWNAPKIKPSR